MKKKGDGGRINKFQGDFRGARRETGRDATDDFPADGGGSADVVGVRRGDGGGSLEMAAVMVVLEGIEAGQCGGGGCRRRRLTKLNGKEKGEEEEEKGREGRRTQAYGGLHLMLGVVEEKKLCRVFVNICGYVYICMCQY
jgi:hypothetical protein